MNEALGGLVRCRSTGMSPIRTEDLDQYSAASRRTAQALHLVLASCWEKQETVKVVLKREFPRIVGYLLFKGREVPRDAGLVDAVEQCPPGGLVLIHGTHVAPVLNLQKPLRLEGVGGGSQKVLLRTHIVVKPKSSQGPPVLSRGITAQFRDIADTAVQEPPPRMTVQLHNIHLMQPVAEVLDSSDAGRGSRRWELGYSNAASTRGYHGAGAATDSQFKARDPYDVDKPLADPQRSLLWVGTGARAQVTQCIFEEAPDSSWGCGIFVNEAGCLEAVDSVVKNADEYGLATSGIAKLARCRIMGSKVGARLMADEGAQLILKGCIFQDNREIGVYLPPVWCFDQGNGDRDDESTWPFRCILKGSSIIRSWYPMAQKTRSDTHWERYPWVEPPLDFAGLRMDACSELQELTEADYDRQLDVDDEGPPSRCPSSIALSETWRHWNYQEDWDYVHGMAGPAPPIPKQKAVTSPQTAPKGSKRHHGPKW